MKNNLSFINEERILGNNSESIKHNNRAMIIRMIKDKEIISRSELVSQTGLTLATITMIIDEFMQVGFVTKAGLVEGNNGRRVMGFRLAKDRLYTISIRLSVSYIAIGLFDVHSHLLDIKKFDWNTLEDLNETFACLQKEINQYIEKIGRGDLLGISLGLQGPFLMNNGHYLIAERRGGSTLFDFHEKLTEAYRVPVLVDRSGNNLAYSLWYNSLFKDTGSYWLNTSHKSSSKIIVYIDISYTVECGIVFNGEILNGSLGYAGNIGNIITGRKNNEIRRLEDSIATDSILREVRNLLPEYPDSELSKIPEIKIRNVITAFNNADPLARYVYTVAGKELAVAVSNLVCMINPDEVYFGDELPNNDVMLGIILTECRKYISADIFRHMVWDMVRVERCVENDNTIITGSRRATDMAFELIDFSELLANNTENRYYK